MMLLSIKKKLSIEISSTTLASVYDILKQKQYLDFSATIPKLVAVPFDPDDIAGSYIAWKRKNKIVLSQMSSINNKIPYYKFSAQPDGWILTAIECKILADCLNSTVPNEEVNQFADFVSGDTFLQFKRIAAFCNISIPLGGCSLEP